MGGDVAGLTLDRAGARWRGSSQVHVGSTPEPGAWLRVFGYPGIPCRGYRRIYVDVDLKGEVGGHCYRWKATRTGQSVKAEPGSADPRMGPDYRTKRLAYCRQRHFLMSLSAMRTCCRHGLIAEAWMKLFDYLLIPENLYRGLEPFMPGDEGVFFGRDEDIAALTARVSSQPVTVVVGPSGVGKSSLVQAGLIPRLGQAIRLRWSGRAKIRGRGWQPGCCVPCVMQTQQ